MTNCSSLRPRTCQRSFGIFLRYGFGVLKLYCLTAVCWTLVALNFLCTDWQVVLHAQVYVLFFLHWADDHFQRFQKDSEDQLPSPWFSSSFRNRCVLDGSPCCLSYNHTNPKGRTWEHMSNLRTFLSQCAVFLFLFVGSYPKQTNCSQLQ